MKPLTLLTVSTLFASAIFCTDTKADELSAELHAATVQQLTELKPATAKQALQGMLQTVIDVKAHRQAEQDASTLLASQVNAVQAAE